MSSVMVSFRGPEAPAWVLEGLRRGEIPAVCLFNYNVFSLEQLRELNLSLMAAAAAGGQPPPIIGIDQEGGQLMAVGLGATELPGDMALGATRSVDLARRTGELLARELLALGCNMNFVPVLDLATQPGSDVLGVRPFGDDPQLAGELGAALIAGLQAAGVLASGKHFPGHGDARVDSHHGAPVIDAALDVLRSRELVPFAAAIGAGVAAIMSCHAVYPALGGGVATHSRAVLVDLLRDELGFRGLVVTDALDMHAFGAMPGLERARLAVGAGADLALLGHLPDQPAIVRALAAETEPASAARVAAVRRRLPTELPPLSLVGCAEHQALARETAEAAVTAVRGDPRLKERERLLVVSVQAGELTPAETTDPGGPRLAAQLRARVPDTVEIGLRRRADAAEVGEVVDRVMAWRAAGPGEVVVGTVNAISDPSQLALLARLTALGTDPVLVALRDPNDVAVAGATLRALCTYGRRSVQTEAAARVLLGEIEARGRLPVTLAGGRLAVTGGRGHG